jgi:hypothetical protein
MLLNHRILVMTCDYTLPYQAAIDEICCRIYICRAPVGDELGALLPAEALLHQPRRVSLHAARSNQSMNQPITHFFYQDRNPRRERLPNQSQ